MAKEKINDHIQSILERILHIKKGIQTTQESPVDLHELAISYYHLDNQSKTISYIERLVKKFPDYIEIASIRALQALSLIELKKWGMAKTIIEERLRVEESDSRLLSMLAYIYEKNGQENMAIETLRKILIIRPKDVNALNSLGYLLSLHGKKEDRPYALSCLYQALKTQPNHPAYLDSLGVYYMKKGDETRAKKALGEALKKAPENMEILDHVRQLYTKKKTHQNEPKNKKS